MMVIMRMLWLVVISVFAGCSDDGPRSAPPGSSLAGSGGWTVTPAAGSAGAGGAAAASGGVGMAGTAAISGGAATAGSAAASGGSPIAGAAGSDAGSGVPATFDTVKLVLGGGGGIMPCSAAPCHGVNGVAPPDRPLELPPMDDSQLYANLTSYVSRACNDKKLVEPGKPDQSALVTILKGPCGATPRMPYGCSPEAGDCIPDEYIQAVAAWITAGARR